MSIIRNAAKCRKCEATIESTHRHDFVMCECGAIGVDGGHDYIRRIGNMEDIEELSESEPKTSLAGTPPDAAGDERLMKALREFDPDAISISVRERDMLQAIDELRHPPITFDATTNQAWQGPTPMVPRDQYDAVLEEWTMVVGMLTRLNDAALALIAEYDDTLDCSCEDGEHWDATSRLSVDTLERLRREADTS